MIIRPVVSTEDKLLQEINERPKFKALPYNKEIMQPKKELNISRTHEPTTFQEFSLSKSNIISKSVEPASQIFKAKELNREIFNKPVLILY